MVSHCQQARYVHQFLHQFSAGDFTTSIFKCYGIYFGGLVESHELLTWMNSPITLLISDGGVFLPTIFLFQITDIWHD